MCVCVCECVGMRKCVRERERVCVNERKITVATSRTSHKRCTRSKDVTKSKGRISTRSGLPFGLFKGKIWPFWNCLPEIKWFNHLTIFWPFLNVYKYSIF